MTISILDTSLGNGNKPGKRVVVRRVRPPSDRKGPSGKTVRPPVTQISNFNSIQTFFVDPQAVNNAPDVAVSSIELFFKQKPSQTRNTSGSSNPGVIISLCEVVNNSPDPTKPIADSTVRISYDQVYALSDASVATVFAFPTPVIIPTNAFYGIVVTLEDRDYKLWTNVLGDALVGTNKPSSSSTNSKDGKYYVQTNSGTFNALNNVDLKYRVNIAQYTANSATLDLVNRDFEFLTLSNTSGTFLGGEFVYQNEANATGNVAIQSGNTTIVGSGTTFTSIVEGGYIVVWNGANTQVLQVDGITNATAMTVIQKPNFTNAAAKFMVCSVGSVYYKDQVANKLYLVDSSANSTLAFDPAGTIQGELSLATATIASVDTYPIDQFVPAFTVDTSSAATVTTQYVLSAANVVNTSLLAATAMNQVNFVDKYAGQILSRSTEVGLATLYGTTKKSALVRMQINIASSNVSLFSAPRVRTTEADFFVYQNKINNTYLNGNLDTEVFKNGLANSKWFSQKTAFANNRFAEDLRVYMTAYRPVGTDLRVYAKIHNSSDTETFDDKLWTPLKAVQNGNVYSSVDNSNDLVEYEFGLPSYPDTNFTVNGSFTTQLANSVIVANGFDPSANLAANDFVKIYNPLFLENYTIGFVTAANSTTFTLSAAISNNNIVGSGFFVDKLLYKGTAFLNKENSNVVRYFTQGQAPVDRFDSMQFKVVLLANNTNVIPSVEDFQAIGLNAGT